MIFCNKKGVETSFQVTVFVGFFDKFYSYVALHKLARFRKMW